MICTVARFTVPLRYTELVRERFARSLICEGTSVAWSMRHDPVCLSDHVRPAIRRRAFVLVCMSVHA